MAKLFMSRKTTRRGFFLLSFLASTYATGWGCKKNDFPSNSSNQDGEDGKANATNVNKVNKASIIVIGAGVAGISAASSLKEKGYKVIVLEGRSRIGGRVWTDTSWKDNSLDMGASWIHGTKGNPITELVQKFNIVTAKTNYDSSQLYDQNGQPVSDSLEENIEKRFETILEKVKKYRLQLEKSEGKDISLQTAFEREIAKLNLSNTELRQLNYSINAVIEHDYAADASDLSLLSWDEDERFGGGDVLFPKGYDQIVKNLAEGLDIRLNQAVKKVEYNNQGVKVTTNSATFEADKVIITLPLGVLKKGTVEFSPALPGKKQAAIKALGMGILNKVYLRFPKVFWDKEPHLLGYISSKKGEWAEILNIYKYTGQPILLAFNAGEYAWKLEKLSDKQIIDEAMKMLRKIYGNNIPNPEASLITRWGQDPFSFGSYSHIKINASSEDYKTLAAPVDNRLFFAGEATSHQHPGTVHGAFLSGQREAKRIGAKANG
jgi:monoamine oxidase